MNIRLWNADYFRGYEVHLVKYDLHKKKTFVATDVVWKEIGDMELFPGFSDGRMDNTEAQELMDNLWKCGVRPTEGAGTAGAMKAAQDNLTDLRGVVNRLLNKIGAKD